MKTIRCPQCNLVCWTTVSFCNRCNFDISNYLNEQGILVPENVERSYSESSAQHFSANSSYNNNSAADYSRTNSANYRQDSQGDGSGYRFNDSANNFRDSRNTSNQGHNYNSNVNTQKSLAIWSLVLGILSMPFILVFITALIAVGLALVFGQTGAILGIILGLMIPVLAISTGVVSIKRVNRNPAEFGGKGLAIAGICCAGFSLLTVPFVAAIAVPNVLAARKAANEGSAISTLKTLVEAESKYKAITRISCADLSVLGDAQMIDSVLKNGDKNGFRFSIKELSTDKCSFTATPIDSSFGNRAFYFSTEDVILRAEQFTGSPANKNSKPLDLK